MPDMLAAPSMVENRPFDTVTVGESARLSRTVTQRDIDLYAVVSGDVNPAHMDPDYARGDIFHHVIAHGMLAAGLISSVLRTLLPGAGTIYLGQELRFRHPVGTCTAGWWSVPPRASAWPWMCPAIPSCAWRGWQSR